MVRPGLESDLAEDAVERLHRLGARVVEARVPPPEANSWPLFNREAAESHRGLFPERADEYGENVRAKLELAQRVPDDEVVAARRSIDRWRRYEPDVDLYVSPCVGDRSPTGGLQRARRAHRARGIHALGQPDRLGRARDREPPVRGSARRGRARGRARLGARRLMAARVLAVAMLALVALTAAACGGGHESASQAYAKQLSSACTDMRKQIEALGKPGDTPISKTYPGTVKIGHAFVKKIRLLEPPAAEKATARKMVQQFGYYFDGLAIGYAVLTKRKSQGGFVPDRQRRRREPAPGRALREAARRRRVCARTLRVGRARRFRARGAPCAPCGVRADNRSSR